MKNSNDIRNKVKALSCVLVITIVLMSFGHKILCQEKINISAGFGIPEFLNVGLRFRLDLFQLGLNVGIPIEGTNSFSGDVRYHFGRFSYLSDRPPWYGKIGLNYLRDEEEDVYIDKYIYFNTRIGREFNISSKFGIELEVGAIYELSYERIRKRPSNSWASLGFDPKVLPSFGIGLFYRF